MPNLEPVVIQGDRYSIRHIGPQTAVWPSSPGAPVAVLANATMVARPLPMSNIPSSPDLVAGTWTGRLGDSGECALTFPNTVASDGVPWRQRFDPTGHLQFVEIYYNGELDSCCVIDDITTIDPTQVQIHGSDGWFLLKKAYERDWTATQAPRDVIERGTQVWVPTVVDDFAVGSSISGGNLITPAMDLFPSLGLYWWQITTTGTGSVTLPNNGGVLLSVGSSAGTALIQNGRAPGGATIWRAQATATAVTGDCDLSLTVTDSNLETYGLHVFPQAGIIALNLNGSRVITNFATQPLADTSFAFQIESDGEWITAFLNGALIGTLRRIPPGLGSVHVQVELGHNALAAACSAVLQQVLTEVQQPFLMAGTDKGDYVLPGDETTYPTGGLKGRYFNDNDLQGQLSNAPFAYNLMVLAPTRASSYGGSAPAEYIDQQDPELNAQNPPAFNATAPGPGPAGLANWSAQWFGAIYLKLSAGNYTLEWNSPIPGNTGVRIWIGQTQFGQQVLDQWTLAAGAGYSFTVSATTLAGTRSDGSTVARDGWYPIKIEFVAGGTACTAGALSILNSPAAYTDPGGTAIASGAQSTRVPPTSLSPLGCVDQRYQGIDHYTLVQQTALAYGYQATVAPKQLESGLFPGVLAPRLQEGLQTDVTLKPDMGTRQDGEGLLNYSSGLDATDFCSSLWGNGAGFQSGTTGQLQAVVYDAATMLASLFDAQQWQDFSDASFISLLQALLNGQLSLQLTPWQVLSADPMGRPRKAYTWPLPGAIASMRWRPGDAVLIHAPLINVVDTEPRQMLVITRNILPKGIASTQATFTERPITPAKVLKQQFYKATRWARNYQRRAVELQGDLASGTLAGGGTGVSSSLGLLPNDQVIGARVLITENSAAQPLQIVINGTTLTLPGAPFVNLPANVAVPVGSGSGFTVVAEIENAGSSTTTVQHQLFVTVLR